jgi:hypothetical protein
MMKDDLRFGKYNETAMRKIVIEYFSPHTLEIPFVFSSMETNVEI